MADSGGGVSPEPSYKPAEAEAAATTEVVLISYSAEAEEEAWLRRGLAIQNGEAIARIDMGEFDVTVNPFFDTRMFWNRLDTFENEVANNSSSDPRVVHLNRNRCLDRDHNKLASLLGARRRSSPANQMKAGNPTCGR